MLDYLIVGYGLFGSVCAHELATAGKKVMVLEKSDNPGGMCYSKEQDGIIVQQHGGHIYHTNDKRLWEYVNRFACWRQYEHRVKVNYHGEVYSFPPNKMTMQQLAWHFEPVDDATIKQVFFRGYSEKQWGRPLEEIPGATIKRIPIRDNWDDRYFTDEYQGLPVGGYQPLFEALLSRIHVEYNTDYMDRRIYWDSRATKTIYTGRPDALLGYAAGMLEYRSLRFEHERLEVDDFQGCATMNYTAADVPFTRVLEHKHFYPAPQVKHTIISREYPEAFDGSNLPYYPVNDERNDALYQRYKAYAQSDGRTILGGRLGTYHYWNMDQTIGAALHLTQEILS